MTPFKKTMTVLMLGEGLDRQGGVVAVERLILDHAPELIRFIHIPTLEDGSAAKKLIVFAKAVLVMIVQLMVNKIGLVHIHVSTGGSVYRKTIVAIMSLAFRRPIIMHAHSGKFPTFFASQPKLAQALIAWAFRRCRRIVAVSHHWQTFYADTLGIDPARIIVLPNPVAMPASLPTRQAVPSIKLVFFGQIVKAKGVFDLLQATALVAGKTDNCFHVTIAGHGNVEDAKAMVDSLDIRKVSTILSWVGPKERDALMAGADVFLLPSYFEGLPMALLEAMSWGLPSITTPVGGIPDIIKHEVNGLFVPPGDVVALAETMQRMIADTSLRDRLGKAAHESIKPYDVKPYTASLATLYWALTPAQS